MPADPFVIPENSFARAVDTEILQHLYKYRVLQHILRFGNSLSAFRVICQLGFNMLFRSLLRKMSAHHVVPILRRRGTKPRCLVVLDLCERSQVSERL